MKWDSGGVYKQDVESLAQALLARATALDGMGRGAEAEEAFAEAIRRLEVFEQSDTAAGSGADPDPPGDRPVR